VPEELNEEMHGFYEGFSFDHKQNSMLHKVEEKR
jgi:hypothetical protein